MNDGLVHQLVTTELGFCCIHSFLREIEGRSARKVGAALGVSHHTIFYWRTKKFNKELGKCQRCRGNQPKLDLVQKDNGWRFLVY